MRIGGVRADDQNDIGLHHAVKILRACRGAISLFQAIAGGRVANARAGIDVVVGKGGAHQFLHHPDFLCGAAR